MLFRVEVTDVVMPNLESMSACEKTATLTEWANWAFLGNRGHEEYPIWQGEGRPPLKADLMSNNHQVVVEIGSFMTDRLYRYFEALPRLRELYHVSVM